jgi:hypothetical protein
VPQQLFFRRQDRSFRAEGNGCLAVLGPARRRNPFQGATVSGRWPNIVGAKDVLKRRFAELRRAFGDDAATHTLSRPSRNEAIRLVAPITAGSALPAPVESAVGDSIVVMPPFVNMSGDAENEYFADGITEEIIDALAQITDLLVGGRGSAFCFKTDTSTPALSASN